MRKLYTIISTTNIDIDDIEELESEKHRLFNLLANASEQERNTVDTPSRIIDYTVAANEEMFQEFQNKNFAQAHKKVYYNPRNETIKSLLQEDMKSNVVSLLEYRKTQIRFISKPEEEIQKAVEKIAKLNILPELNADLAIREAANDMFFEQENPNTIIEKEEKKIAHQQQKIPNTSFFGKIKANIKKWFY